MEKITKIECAHCKDVKHIFEEFIETEQDFCVVDAYPFGYLVLEWYEEEHGFSNQKFFGKASDLFDYLLEYWERTMVFRESASNGNLEYKELNEILPQEMKEHLELCKHDYIMQYEAAAMIWEGQDMLSHEERGMGEC